MAYWLGRSELDFFMQQGRQEILKDIPCSEQLDPVPNV